MKRLMLAERFWSKVRKSSGCWLWKGAVRNDGYGWFSRTRQEGPERAHRMAWQLIRGIIPKGKQVLHKCDTPQCVRLSHLFLGTHRDNMSDMFAKGRRVAARGSENGKAKLSEGKVLELFKQYASGRYTCRSLALQMGMGNSTVAHVLGRRRQFSWVKIPKKLVEAAAKVRGRNFGNSWISGSRRRSHNLRRGR